jgi:hypothetical protein
VFETVDDTVDGVRREVAHSRGQLAVLEVRTEVS